MDLLQAFPDEQSCINHLERRRWNGNVISPFDETSKVYKCKNNRYRCKNTGKYFNVKTQTLFDSSNVPLRKWFVAIWLLISHKKGISSIQLSKDIGVTQRTAWFMLHRIRKCLGVDNDGKLDQTVESDETFVGGKNKNRHADKKVKYSQGRSFKDKTPVIGIIERETKRMIARTIPSTGRKNLHGFIHNHVAPGARLMTDEWLGYRGLGYHYDHKVVDHGKKQYVDGEAHCNTVEGSWSILKRMIIGIYHYTSRKHLQQYVHEFVFRYNTRSYSEQERFNFMLSFMGNRLTYNQLVCKT